MKNILKYITAAFLLLLMVNCQDDNVEFGSLDTPTNLAVKVDIVGKSATAPNGDGSGKVLFTATADNAISYKYIFSDGTSQNAPSGIFEKGFAKPGTNTYTVLFWQVEKVESLQILLLRLLYLVILKMMKP